MGIEHYVADERIPFKDTIVRNFIDEYRQGRTPNPCVMCNPLFKFRVLTEWADRLNCGWCYRALFPFGRTEWECIHCGRG